MVDNLRDRARSFGSHAEDYDRSRPSYPPLLIHDLLADEPETILDVGCGTAKAARLLGGPGRRVLGVEPDARMAAVAAAHGIEVEVAIFETWDPAGRRFDLVVSAQAWHWIDPVAGARKAAEVLRPGGRFGAFWNGMHHGAEVEAVFAAVYGRHAPRLLETSVALGVQATIDGRADLARQALSAEAFRLPEVGSPISYDWTLDYTAAEWIGLLRTHSDHATLDPEIREPLLVDLAAELTRLGPSFAVRYRTDLLSATRV